MKSAQRLILAGIFCAFLIGCRLVTAGPKVAFLGDSITEGWSYPSVNLGVHGNTTAQMRARFPLLVPGHGYKTVVILGGTNDLLLGLKTEETIHNLEALGDQTVQEHAEPILCEIPPIFHSYQPGDRKDYIPSVIDLNRRIAALAAGHDWKLIDFYTPLADHPTYSSDGVHMRRRGYLVMELALLQEASKGNNGGSPKVPNEIRH